MFCRAKSPWAAPVLTLAGRTLAWVAPAGRQGDMSDSTDRPAVAVTARCQRSLFPKRCLCPAHFVPLRQATAPDTAASPIESESAAQSRKPRISAQIVEGWLRCAGEARRKLGLALLDRSLQPLESRLELVAIRISQSDQPRQGLAVPRAKLSDRLVCRIAASQRELEACEPRQARRLVGLQRDDLDRGRCLTPRRECPGEQGVGSAKSGIPRDRLPDNLLGPRVLASAEMTLCEDELRADAERIPLQTHLLQPYGLRPTPRTACQLTARRQYQQICRIDGFGTGDAALRPHPVELAHLQPRQADVGATGIPVEG